jgi:glycosyltransferase involved in cell wall biosynthesis
MPHSILLLHGSAEGYGADLQLYAVATGLDRSRFVPLVVLPGPAALADRLVDAGVETHFAPLAMLRRDVLRARRAVETWKLVARNRSELGLFARRRGIALVHSNTSIVLSGQAVADAAGTPHVLHVREIFHGMGGRVAAGLWPFYRKRLSRADALVCVSEAAARQFNGSSTTEVVYDGVLRRLILPARTDARAQLGLPAEAFVVAVTGRISDWKGQHLLVRALASPLLAELGTVGLLAGDVATGQERFRDDLLQLAAELGVESRLRLLGFRDDVGTVLAAADVAAIPSIYEDPFPQAALEAAAHGVPLVVTRSGGLPEIVRDGVTGWIVPRGDAEALAAALRRVADDPDGARRAAVAAAADVSARFETARMIAALEALYERLLR